MRLGRFHGKAWLHEARVLFQRGDNRLRRRLQLGIVAAHNGELQAVARAANTKAVGLGGEYAHRRYAFDALGNISHDLLLAARAFLPRRQRQDDEAVIGRSAGTRNGIGGGDFTTVAQRLDRFLDPVEL